MSLELAPRCLRPAMEPRLATMPEGAAAINLRHLYKRFLLSPSDMPYSVHFSRRVVRLWL